MARKASAEVRIVRALRLRAQGLVAGVRPWTGPAEVARGMLAMQAQDARGVLWALAVRSAGSPDEATVLDALADGTVVRNRPSRGTLQVTAPEDLHWLSATMTPRSLAAAVKRRDQIGVTDEMIEGVGDVLRDLLSDGPPRTRPQIVEACARAGIDLDGTQAGHVLRHHTEVMTIVFGPPAGRAETFVLAEHRIADDERRTLDGAAALGELVTRLVDARGPVTVKDIGRWANLTMGDVRAGVEAAGDALEPVELAGTAYLVSSGTTTPTTDELEAALGPTRLLAPFDEYLLGYGERDALIDDARMTDVVPGRNGMFKPIVVIDGEVVGTWSRKATTTKKVAVSVAPFRSLTRAETASLDAPLTAYGSFLGLTPELTVT